MDAPPHELVRVRLEKLARIRARGIDPYPQRFDRTHTTKEAVSLFEAQEQLGNAATEAVTVAGRMVAFRDMGRASFADLLDGDGRIQVLFRSNTLSDSYDLIADLDIGDWLGAAGPVFRTRSGEVTLEVRELTVLCKSLRPLPEKWHGLADVETRFRQRYLDLIANEESRSIALLRARMVSSIRRFMEGRGFVEVETPVLVQVPAGGMALPFATHYNFLDRDLYLRIATELYLKRLIVGGIEKVFEIGRVFRNEGVDFYHNPEYTMMESYEAFADYNDVMRMVEEMVHSTACELLGGPTVEFGGHQIDFTPPWPRLSLREQVREHSGIDFPGAHRTTESLRAQPW